MHVMKKTSLLLGLFFLFIYTCSPVLADENDDELDLLLESLDIEEDYKYEYPEIEPIAHIHIGYRYVDHDDSSQVFEYEYLENSVVAGGELRAFNFPHRFFLDVDFDNKEDYFGELRYAYGDLLLFRWLSNSYYHNLENIRLYSFNPLTSSPDADGTKDAGRDYGIGSSDNRFRLLMKAPKYPLHVYFDGFYMAKDGDTQQRNLGGSGFFNNMLLYSQGRNVDTLNRIYKIGANSHLGLVEIDFAHTEKRFSVDKDRVFEGSYTGSGYRPAGDYKYSRTPEIDGSGNILKVHTSYTGKWVASATILQNERENQDSGAESEVTVGTGSVKWSPLTSLSFVLRYTHRDLDNDSPSTVTVSNFDSSSSWSETYDVRQPVSSKTDTLALTGRYKPVKGLTFRAKYVFQEIDRTHAEAWNLTDSTTRNTVTLVADSRLHNKVLFNIKYAYQNISDPAYNTEPEDSHIGSIDLTWLPHSKVNFLFSYDFNHQERDNLDFISIDGDWDRETDTNNFLAVGTFQMSQKFTLSASYSYLDYEVQQDIIYQDLTGVSQVDRNVDMDQTAHVFTLGGHYRFSDALYLMGKVSHTRSKGKFSPNSDDLLEPVSIASFSKMEQRHLFMHLGAEYKLSDGLSLDLDYRFGDLEDTEDNDYDDIEDGDSHIIILSATKKW